MYNLIVSNHFHDWSGGAIGFDRSRFLEYTSEPIEEQLRSLSIEAIDCIQSWPCVLMEEGRSNELVRVARITELHSSGREIQLTVEPFSSKTPIWNDHIWRIREALDIGQFEFSRNHWAVKERDLLSVLRAAGHEVDTNAINPYQERPLPAPARQSLIEAKNSISAWSHSRIDDLMLEAGVGGLSAGRDVGSRRDRANAILQFAIDNPSAVTAEKSLLSAYLVKRACEVPSSASTENALFLDFFGGTPAAKGAFEGSIPDPTQEGRSATNQVPEAGAADRSPNRVFVVHGQNGPARAAVVSFLEGMGLVGVVLHEQPNMGRHLLTKFIEEAELTTFAVVVMTDDDEGRVRGGKLAPRARQNVILELGYFLAYLGQEKVCALISPGLETPSDFDGIVYIRMDDDTQEWKGPLRRELQAAGMPVT